MTRSPIHIILFLSFAIHITVLFVWNLNKNEISASQASQQNTSVIPVLLKTAATHTKPAQAKATPGAVQKKIAPQKKQSEHKIVTLTKQQPAQHKLTIKTPPATAKKITIPTVRKEAIKKPATISSPPPAPVKTSINRNLIQQRIRKQLNLKLAFSRYYPALAIRNQWQGTVNLGIRIQADGQLGQVHVVNSSGYRILDQAAVNSVMKIIALPEARQWLNGDNLDVILPVIYQLADG